MTNLESISEVSAIWEKKNSNCAQATGKGLLDHFNYKDAGNVLFSSFFPFVGGFMSCNICGAVSGTLAAMSFILWKKNKSMEEIMHLSDQMKEKFVNEFGSDIDFSDIDYGGDEDLKEYTKSLLVKANKNGVVSAEDLLYFFRS